MLGFTSAHLYFPFPALAFASAAWSGPSERLLSVHNRDLQISGVTCSNSRVLHDSEAPFVHVRGVGINGKLLKDAAPASV